MAGGPIDAVVRLPGSKSLTNRELVLAALADGPGEVRGALVARDTRLMADAIAALDSPAPRRIDVGLAGTVMRFLPIVAALHHGDTVFDGDEAARLRPMGATIASLRALGVEVGVGDGGERLPFTVHGTGRVRGGEVVIDASASSQFVSGLLLAAARFELGLVLRHEGGRLPSLPHIEMTIACLRARGVDVGSPDEGVWTVAPGPIAARDVEIEPDLSNAAPFLAAALVAGGSVSTAWPRDTTQVGDDLRALLRAFGGETSWRDGVLTVRRTAPIHGAGELDLSHAGELAPTLAGLAALADSPTRITGIGHLRGHETDRLAALADDLGGLGGRVTVLDDGLLIEPAPLTGGPWRAYGDHRMATTGALIGLAVPGVVVDDIGAVSKTLPEFVELWKGMLGEGMRGEGKLGGAG